jgi:hypothetical protein
MCTWIVTDSQQKQYNQRYFITESISVQFHLQIAVLFVYFFFLPLLMPYSDPIFRALYIDLFISKGIVSYDFLHAFFRVTLTLWVTTCLCFSYEMG